NATQTFQHANTYTGATTITSGGAYFNASNGIPTGSNVFIGSGGSLNLGGFDESIGTLSGTGPIIMSTAALTVNSASSSTYSGVINFEGNGFLKAGIGTLTLAGTNAGDAVMPTTINGV